SLTIPGFFCCNPTTIWRIVCRTVCTPFPTFRGLLVSGLLFSRLSALGEEKLAFRPFVFMKFSALDTLSLQGIGIAAPAVQFVRHPCRCRRRLLETRAQPASISTVQH